MHMLALFHAKGVLAWVVHGKIDQYLPVLPVPKVGEVMPEKTRRCCWP